MASFQDLLRVLDSRCAMSLRKALERCAGAWVEASGDMRESAQCLRSEVPPAPAPAAPWR
eukprot:CAMPEP_0171131444 /NCGR_PEP_ID=MMETSP0766_2-20121228/122732_1 /TAXON_ID=439317 /ORGANISM="Gambierdiscus australes, Strain CAWD 149" /LENGTH=59 /DNA_ID=CAMNT_0011594741 /DNA_START=1 /DNA_END=177 /DNA_ORIENTATION=+